MAAQLSWHAWNYDLVAKLWFKQREVLDKFNQTLFVKWAPAVVISSIQPAVGYHTWLASMPSITHFEHCWNRWCNSPHSCLSTNLLLLRFQLISLYKLFRPRKWNILARKKTPAYELSWKDMDLYSLKRRRITVIELPIISYRTGCWPNIRVAGDLRRHDVHVTSM